MTASRSKKASKSKPAGRATEAPKANGVARANAAPKASTSSKPQATAKGAHFKSLGHTSKQNYDNPDPSILESFPSPFADRKQNPNGVVGTLHIEAPEFTTVCPITGQPDFATIIIDYQPDQLCVESKSLKLYLGAFRMHPEFHEGSVNRIANDLVNLLDPIGLRVEGRFTPRGGIPFWPVASYARPPRKR